VFSNKIIEVEFNFGNMNVIINLGISRLERWTRAQDYGLDPPAEVKKIIEEHDNDTKFTQWFVC
jgi:hypothetical protein